MIVSPPRISRLLLVLLLLVPPLSRAADGDEVPAKKPPVPTWKFRDEEHWIVDETARTIAELLAFAKDRKTEVEVATLPNGTVDEAYKLTAKLGASTVSAEIVWKDFIWSPEEHAAWAQQLIAAWKLVPSPTAPGEAALLQALTEPTPQTIERERRRISAALTKTPLDAGLHTQAALVTAAFAMHEAAGRFSDIRRELCRISAHLAIVRALAPDDSGAGRRLAEAALHALTGRQTPALTALATLESETSAGVSAWMRALRLRASGDWRPASEQPTLFEQLEIFRARYEIVSGSFALQWLKDRQPAPVQDWRRIVLSGGFGVEQGHQFAKDSISQEISGLQNDYTAFFGGKLPAAEIVTALNTPAQRSIIKGADGRAAVSVLGWDFWSAQHQRHLCQSIRATNFFFRDKWGVDEYRDMQKFVRQNFAALTLFPVIDRELTDDPSRIPDIAARMNKLLDSHPELIGRPVWDRLRVDAEKSRALPDLIHASRWLRPVVPFGTVYDLDLQTAYAHLPALTDTAWWDALLALAPTAIAPRECRIYKEFNISPPLATVEAAYTPMQDFNQHALNAIAAAQKNHSKNYPDTLLRICQWSPVRYFALGDYFRDHAEPERAAEAYQKGVDLSPDRVAASTYCGWLVSYLEEHGKPEQALAIATMAAEVYSKAGLTTMARLQERRGNLAAAEDYFKKIDERYHLSGDIDAFYRRNRSKDPSYESLAEASVARLFPGGVKKVALADLQGEPAGGAVLKTTNEKTAAYGLAVGDVFVAVDGCLARSKAQYFYLRSLSDDPKIRLIIWNPKGYREIEANLPDRQFGVDLGDYKKK